MPVWLRCGVAVALALLVRPVAVSGQVPQSAGATGAISGVVIDAVTKRPVRGAIVTLGPAVLIGTGTRQLTDDRGRFIFLDLPAADNYTLAAAKVGYLDRSNVVRPRPIALAPRQWLQDQTLEVIPEGSISGTVRNERGEPVVGARVRLLALVPIAGRVRAAGGFVATTDDRGVYRIAGLPEGRYAIAVPSVQHTVPADTSPAVVAGRAVAQVKTAGAGEPAISSGAARATLDIDARHRLVIDGYVTPPAPDAGGPWVYPPTFHPNALTLAEAAPVVLAAGQQRETVDVQLRPVRAWRVTGQVTGSASPAGLPLRLLRAGDDDIGLGGEVATSLVEAGGRFTFLNVPAGRYVVDLRPSLVAYQFSPRNQLADRGDPLPVPPGFGAAPGSSGGRVDAAPMGVGYTAAAGAWDQTVWARAEVDVAGGDVTVVVPLQRPSRLAGRVVWERRSPAPQPSGPAAPPNDRVGVQAGMRQTIVSAMGADAAPGLGTLTAVVASDDTFAIDGLLPGEYVLRVRGAVGAGVSVKSISLKGADHTHAPFDLSVPAEVADVVITLTDQTQSVSGTVTGAVPGGDGVAVIAFPVDPARWANYGLQPVLLRSVEASATGRFEVALPAGDFYLIAVDRSQARAWTDPAFLDAAARVATRVSLAWGEKKTQDLRFVEVAR